MKQILKEDLIMFKDYYEMVLKPSMGWLKKHWIGYLVFVVIAVAANITWWFHDDIIEHFKKR